VIIAIASLFPLRFPLDLLKGNPDLHAAHGLRHSH
jgi:hypothetical protein